MSDWIYIAKADDFPSDSGACVKVGEEQIAVFNYGRREWYAVQNLCPHNRQMVLSRGLLGDSDGKAKISCPLHKNSFLLESGEHMGGREDFRLRTFSIKEEGGGIYLSRASVEAAFTSATDSMTNSADDLSSAKAEQLVGSAT